MSLINDALKRASTARPGVPDANAGGPALEPAEREAGPRFGVVPMVLCIVGIGALLVAGGLWLKAKGTPPISNPAPQAKVESRGPTPAVSAKTAAPTAAAASPLSSGTSSASSGTEPRNPVERAAAVLEKVHEGNVDGEKEADAINAVVSARSAPEIQAHAEAGKASPVPASKPEHRQAAEHATAKPHEYKLQAIYYRFHGPTVVINGKTLKAGDHLDGAKVLSIQRMSVELDVHGETRTLTLP